MSNLGNAWMGDMIRQQRILKNKTQKDLADFLGLENAQFISQIEKGKSKVPVDMFGRLCEFLGIDKLSSVERMTKTYRVQLATEMGVGLIGNVDKCGLVSKAQALEILFLRSHMDKNLLKNVDEKLADYRQQFGLMSQAEIYASEGGGGEDYD